jgi:large subunit ribosomal protein L30e
MAKSTDNEIEDIKRHLKEGKVLIGSEEVLKGLRKGVLSRIIMASNCNPGTADDIRHYSKIAGAEVTEASIPNDELGVVCKKPYAISVLGIVR